MNQVVEFFKNFGKFIVSINVNAFWSIIYWFSQNWFALLSIVFITYLAYIEIKIKTDYIIDDERQIY